MHAPNKSVDTKVWNWTVNDSRSNSSSTRTAAPVSSSWATLERDIAGWFAFSITIGVAGSSLLIFLLLTSFYNEGLRKGSRILIIHLMVLQFLVCGVDFPILTISSYMTLEKRPIHIHCPTFLYLDIAITHVENWASTLLALNRYIAIKMPHQYHKIVTKPALFLTMAIPWLIGLCDTLPVYLGIGGQFLFVLPYGCNFIPTGHFYANIWVAIGAYIPITVMGITYVVLFAQLAIERYHRKGQPTRPEDGPAKLRQERRITTAKILVGSFLWYCLCFLPDVVINTAFTYLYGKSFMMHLWLVSVLHIGFAGSTVIFLILGSDYRNGGKLLLRRVWSEISSRSSASSTVHGQGNAPAQSGNELQLGSVISRF